MTAPKKPAAAAAGDGEKKETAAKTAPAAEVNAAIADGTAPADLDADAKFYCPGCGKRSDLEGECVGSDESPHAAISYVSTKELAGDPSKHTAAPGVEG